MNKFSGSDDPGYIAVTRKIAIILRYIRTNSVLDEADAWIRDKHYTEGRLKIERLSGDQLPIDQCYINLAIVEQPGRDAARSEEGPEKGDTPLQSSPFSLHARLKTETPDKNIQVELPTLFNPRKGRHGHETKPRRILIRGRAGVGKTTLCKKIVHDFIRGTWNDLFDRILWVPLRRLKTWKPLECDLAELFYHEYFIESSKGRLLAEELWRAIEGRNGGKTLFILDGLDEVARDLHSDDNMFRLLTTLLNQPNVIITSRPYGSLPPDLHPLDLELETIGFYPDQVKEYIEKTLGDRRKVVEIQSFLQHRLLVQGLVRIPIQLDALCFTWDEGFSRNPMLQTMTAIYQAIEQRLWRKDVLRLEKKDNGEPVTYSHIQDSDPSEIEDLVKDEIYFLEGLAFTGLHNDVIDFEARHRRHIAKNYKPLATTFLVDKTLPRLSFLRTSDPSAEHSSRSYHFLHLTFQEYFAARYFVRQWTSGGQLTCLKLSSGQERTIAKGVRETNAEEFLRKEKYNARYDIFWRFVAGLLQANGGDAQLYRLFRTIEDQPRDLLGPVHQRLVMHCLSEVVPSQETSNFNRLREDLEGQLKQWLLFECNFEFNGRGLSQLAAEMEFPEPILKDVLQNESENVQMKILGALTARPKISPTIMGYAASCLGDNISGSLKQAALEVFERPREDLPEGVLQGLAALLKDPDRDVRSAAAAALGWQLALPEAILQELAALLKDPDRDVQYRAAEALGHQPMLPEAILQELIILLKDLDRDVQDRVVLELLDWQQVLPEAILQGLTVLLKDLDVDVQQQVVEALAKQPALPEAILQELAVLLKDLNKDV